MRDILSMENNDIGPGKFELSDKITNSEEFGTIKIQMMEMEAKHQEEMKEIHIKYENSIVEL